MAQTGPIRFVVPFAPGGGIDGVARVIANDISMQLGRTVIVENRPGASTYTGAELVAGSEPDGDTLLFTVDETFTVMPLLFKEVAFNPAKELTPVTLVGKILMPMLINPALPVTTLPKFIEYARAKPTAVSYGSTGAGSLINLSMEMLKSITKVHMLHVPYRGTMPALNAVVAGEVQLTMAGYGTAGGLIRAGMLRPIAIAGPERMAEFPEIPSTLELGYPQVDATTYVGVAAPAKTSPEIVERVNQMISTVLKSDQAKKDLIEGRHFVIADAAGPEEYSLQLKNSFALNETAVEIAGVSQP